MSDEESGVEVTTLILERVGSEGAWVRLVYERQRATGSVNGPLVARIIEGVGEVALPIPVSHWWERGDDFKVTQEPAWR